MNREQRRRMVKKYGNDVADRFINPEKPQEIPERQKVRLNYSKITGRKDYPRMQDRYRVFVEEHQNDVFTVEYDKTRKDNTFVCLAEDPGEVKWLWWAGDLEVVL